MAKKTHKRNKNQRERDLAILSELYLKGITEYHMAEVISDQYDDFNISVHQIRKDKQELRIRWMESQLINFDEAKARELEVIDQAIAACWVGWERSLRDEGYEVTEKSESDQLPGGQSMTPIKMKTQKKVERRAKRDGTMAWIEEIRKLSDQRAKILGLYEAEKFQIDWRERLVQSGMDQNAIEQTLESALAVAEKAFQNIE